MTERAGVGVDLDRVDTASCLLLQGAADASVGRYTPTMYELVLRGNDLAQHHVMHLHEIHHKVLNDDTAWGALIHVVARHPVWAPVLLGGLVDACRLVHESFASFMSLLVARSRHRDADEVLEAYPVYQPLARRMARLLEAVPGHQRQYLAAVGIARWCMSAPVFDLALASCPQPVTLSAVPSSWRPDHRFRALSAVSPHSVGSAVAAADVAFEARHGQPVDDPGCADTDERLDTAWAEWEETFVGAVVASETRLQRMPTVATNGHLPVADALVEALGRDGVQILLPRDRSERPISDVESLHRLMAAVTIPLRPEPWPAALAVVDDAVELDAVLDLCAGAPQPFVVVHVRRTSDLITSFAFGPGDRAHLSASAPGPILAVRVLVDHDDSEVVLHGELPEPSHYDELVARWSDRGVAANCVTASCYLDTDWQRTWKRTLHRWPTVVLVDTGPMTMIGEGRLLGGHERIQGAYLDIPHPSLEALVCKVEGHPHVLLAIGDDLTIQFLAGQLADLLGDRLVMSGADWSEWADVLAAVAASTLATEFRLHFRGTAR